MTLDGSLIIKVLVVLAIVALAVWGFFTWDRRYRGAPGAPELFQPTGETFRDPTTHKMMRVYSNPASGERQYREDPPGSG